MALKNGITGSEKEGGWKDRKEWLMLLLSLLLAFIVWLIHSLSLQYSAVSKDVLIVRGKSDGYYILKQRIGRRKTLQVSASQDNLRHRDGDEFYVLSESIKSNIVEALGGSVDLEFIVTDSLDFTFPRITSKRVPVVPRSSVTFRPQYMPLTVWIYTVMRGCWRQWIPCLPRPSRRKAWTALFRVYAI